MEAGACNCFIVEKPVKREIFAAPFKDRIVHHILIDALNPCFERFFIKDSFACRTGKGTLAAIKRLAHFVNSVTQNGKKDACILKRDIKGYFMSINRNLLYEKLERFKEQAGLSAMGTGTTTPTTINSVRVHRVVNCQSSR